MNNKGVVLFPSPIRNYDYQVCRGTSDNLPEEFSLPAGYLPPVYDQGQVGACLSFAMCQCAEVHARKNGLETEYEKLWNYGRNECRKSYEGEGLIPVTAMDGTLKVGFVPHPYFPDLKEVPDAIKLANERDDLLEMSKNHTPSAYASLAYAMEDKTWDCIKNALASDEEGVIIISHDYFRGGGHAVLGTGYALSDGKKKGRYVEFQNSWGKTWSGDGRSKMPLSYVDEAYVFLWDDIILPFKDVTKEDWFFKPVRSVYLSGLMEGVSSDAFEPKLPLIRGDFAVMLSRFLQKTEFSVNTFVKSKSQSGDRAYEISFPIWNSELSPFDDIDDYYKDSICHIFANKLMIGVDDDLFMPKKSMTRAETAATVVRTFEAIVSMFKKSMPDVYFGIDEMNPPKFKDVSDDAWYKDYVNEAYQLGLMEGESEDIFSPDREIIRCEGAAIFNRLVKAIENLMRQAV